VTGSSALSGWDGRPLPVDAVDEAPVLSRSAVDRAVKHRGDAGWLAMGWLRDRVKVLRIGPSGEVSDAPPDILAAGEPALPWLPGSAVAPEPPAETLLLGQRDGEILVATLDGAPQGPGLRELGALLSGPDAAFLTMAVALADWHRTHRYCPRCGVLTTMSQSGWARRCPVDRSDHFPRTDPAVIMLVRSPDGERAVLGRQPTWPPGRYSCLAGFVEAGESAEQAVAREVFEESSVQVRDVRPVASQPWPFPRSLMLGFFATADDDAEPHSNDGELADVRWFSRADITAQGILLPPPISIAHRLLSAWLRGASP
jgi:NAD+ diphosphatase